MNPQTPWFRQPLSQVVLVQNWTEELKRFVPYRLMSLHTGTTLGPSAVTAKIGEGGMGEV